MTCPENADADIKAEYAKLYQAFLRGEEGSVDKISELRKRAVGRVIPKNYRDTLLSFERFLRLSAENTKAPALRIETDYFRDSKEMGKVCVKDGSYWDSNIELTARAFAAYILDKLPNRSDYLAGHAECAIAHTADKDGNARLIRAYPQDAERTAINAVFDEIFADLRAQNYFTA